MVPKNKKTTSSDQNEKSQILDDGVTDVVKIEDEIISNPGNLLFDLHIRLLNAVIEFRDQVIKECGISIPTYHRIMRKPPIKTVRAKKKAAIPNSDKKQILTEFKEILSQLNNLYSDLMTKHKIKM